MKKVEGNGEKSAEGEGVEETRKKTCVLERRVNFF